MSAFKDVFGSIGDLPGGAALLDVNFAKSYPTLHLLLTATVDDDGKKRQTCTLNVVCEDGVAKAGLRERDRGLSLWVSSETILGVFTALEEALGERPARWRKVDWKPRR